MARPREFDTDTALGKAKNVFWDLGYAEATLPALLKGMSLTRGSLYKAFTDKKSLFLQILQEYDEQEVEAAISFLRSEERSGWDKVLGLFQQVIDAVEAGDRRGCLLCSAIAGPAKTDDDIAAATARSIDRLRTAFADALANEATDDEASRTASLMVSLYIGMRIQARAGASLDMLKESLSAIERLART